LEFSAFEKKEFIGLDDDEKAIPEFKCVVLGDMDVGKSTFIDRFAKKSIRENEHGFRVCPVALGTTQAESRLIFGIQPVRNPIHHSVQSFTRGQIARSSCFSMSSECRIRMSRYGIVNLHKRPIWICQSFW
jgi:GTPase SAR1 family protein